MSSMRPGTSAMMRISPLLGSTRPVAEAAQVSAVFAAGLAAAVVEEVVLASCVLACVFSSPTGPQLTLLT